jgi:hypothetical protein
MIDNIQLILPLLKFESKDDFYYLQILQRKKENPQIGSNSRVIKNYYITSEEYLLSRYDEIKKLCEIFNARAMIRLNKRSFEKVGFKTMTNLANTMMNREYQFLKASYDRACGLGHNDNEKKWILDIDEPYEFEKYSKLIVDIGHIEPIEMKHLAVIKSKSGYHLITKPFNLEKFRNEYPEIEVHKDNPTNLYIP